MSLETRTKLQQGIKGVLNCCKLKIAFKCQTRVSNSVRYKDPTPKDFISGAVYKFQCCLCNDSYYGEIIRHLDIRSQEHIGVSVLLERRSKHQLTMLFVIIYFAVIFYPLLITLVFQLIKTKSIYWELKKDW